jgi:hypothetical protein
MVERSRKSRPTAGLCATQRGADELRRRSTNSSPMNEGEIFRCAKPRELGKRGKNLPTAEPHSLYLSRRPAPARKWRRNGLKRLNPRPRMVWSPKPRSHNIWYTGAWLTVRSGELISEPRLRPSGHGIRSAGRPMGNFPPRKALKSLETGIESRRRLRLSGRGLRIRRARTPREKTLQKKAPNVLKSHEAELKSAEASEGSRRGSADAVIASDSEAIQTKPQMRSPSLDCFALLAMTDRALVS